MELIVEKKQMQRFFRQRVKTNNPLYPTNVLKDDQLGLKEIVMSEVIHVHGDIRMEGKAGSLIRTCSWVTYG